MFTRAASAGERAADPGELQRAWGHRTGQVVMPALEAVDRARDAIGPTGTVLLCGSLYLVGEVREPMLAAA